MDNSLAQIHFWANAAAAAVFVLFSIYLGFGWRGGRLGGRLLTAVVLSALWAVLEAGFGWSGLVVLKLAAFFVDIARLAAWAHFLFGLLAVVTTNTAQAAARMAALRRIGWVVLACAAATPFIGLLDVVPLRWGVFPVLALAVWMLVLTEQVYRNFPAGSRWGVKPLVLGMFGVLAFDLYLYAEAFLFGSIDTDVAAIRGVVYAMAVPLVAMSAVRSRDWAFRITVSRDLVFHSAALAGSGIYLLVIAAAGYYVRWFGGSWGRALQAVLLFSGLLLLVGLVFSGSFRARLRVLLNKHLFAYRYDYRRAWLDFTHVLSSSASGQSLEQRVINALANLVESPAGVLWMRDADGAYRPHAQLNQRATEGVEPAEGSFCSFLHERGWIVNIEEWRSRPGHYQGLNLPEWLASMPDAWLIVPLLSGTELIGFVVLATARVPIEVDWEVLDLLKTAGRQAASYLAQAQAIAALLEAQKFDSFNRMSAFVVHDLKNLVAQLALMLKNADRHKDNPEFQADMLSTVEHVTGRMRGLMTQLQNKSPIEQKRVVDVGEVCRAVVESRKGVGSALACEVEPDVAVSAHAERLERIIGHVVQNALEATPEHGKVDVSVRRVAGSAEVVVHDTGSGMSPEFVRERLFRPFQTTKPHGMGIGTYEVQQYVQELGGSVSVDSQPGQGTRVSILLPVVERAGRAAA